MMKTILKLAVAAGVALVYGQAYAFHSGGVAECVGCHQMHDAPSTNNLLIRSDSSSTCLSCHEHAGDTGPSSYHISTADADLTPVAPPKQRTPGGDFGWLKRSYADTGIGYAEPGYQHGHNIVATANAYVADGVNSSAPGGGGVSASTFSCISCHDQHSSIRRFFDGSYARTGLPIANSGSYNNSAAPISGKTAVGVYRILRGGGSGASNDASVTGATFSTIFTAVAPSSYNRTEASTETRVAYGLTGTVGTGAWCATCHPGMHHGSASDHPVDQAINSLSLNYNAYVSSGIMTGTGTTFTSLVPFQEDNPVITGAGSLASHAQNNNSYMTGPTNNDQVTCMSCHRAHASGFIHAVRWQLENEFLTKGDSLGNPVWCATDVAGSGRCALGRPTTEVQAAYYDRPVAKLGAWQRSLCNKCHAKD
jgi:predicted CXXCH cytochrome family protein